MEALTATGGKFVEESTSAPPPMETPTPQASTLSQIGNEAAGAPVTPTAWPDPVPAGAAVQAQNPIAIPTDTPADSASDIAERAAGGRELTNNAGISMVTIFAVLALGLAVVGIPIVAKVAKITARRVRMMIDHREPGCTSDQRQLDSCDDREQRGSIDERQLLVSALSDRWPVRSDDVPIQTTFEIRKRKDRLAQLHQNLDRLLLSPMRA